jgi:hypothetical protein
VDTLAKACEGVEVFNSEDEKEFSPEFKREAVALLESSDRPLM